MFLVCFFHIYSLQNNTVYQILTYNQQDFKKKMMTLQEEENRLGKLYQRWDRLNQLLGDATGGKFRKIAQSYVLSNLLHSANGIFALSPTAIRFTKKRGTGSRFTLDAEMLLC